MREEGKKKLEGLKEFCVRGTEAEINCPEPGTKSTQFQTTGSTFTGFILKAKANISVPLLNLIGRDTLRRVLPDRGIIPASVLLTE